MTDNQLDQAAAQCVEDLLEALSKEGGQAWFLVVRAHMKKLVTPPRKRLTKEAVRRYINQQRALDRRAWKTH